MNKKSKVLKKNLSSLPQISKEMSLCIRNRIKVYPVSIKNKWFIEVDNKGQKKTFEKSVTQDEIQESVIKTYLFYYEKLIKK